MSTIVPLAHAGHWIEGVIYFVPVVVVVGALWLQSWRDRRSVTRAAITDPQRRSSEELRAEQSQIVREPFGK